ADGADSLAELDRHGIKPGQRVHLSPVPEPGRAGATGVDKFSWLDDPAGALQLSAAAKHPPFGSAKGMLAGVVPPPTWEDFEEASRVAATDAAASRTLLSDRPS